MTKHITYFSPHMPSGAKALRQKGNVVSYLDKELVEKSKELGFNLSKTFENHLKHLVNGYSPVLTQITLILANIKVTWWGRPDLNRGL